ncbi:class I SAM-dependent methyltransferase [Actinomadura adrarensis]|uniref:Class I SAM-dependent methyltransferase n=1 Tax=Actinomadura adrarensis TaxID=1819600 RepID=A0ABW3CMW9_9ACTN
MEGFDPRTSFGYEISKRYDAEDTRGDEDQTVAFLAGQANGQDALEFAIGTGRIALPLARAGVRVDGIELSPDMVDRMREKTGRRPYRRGHGGHVAGHHRTHVRPRLPGLQHDRESARSGRAGAVLRERRPAPR